VTPGGKEKEKDTQGENRDVNNLLGSFIMTKREFLCKKDPGKKVSRGKNVNTAKGDRSLWPNQIRGGVGIHKTHHPLGGVTERGLREGGGKTRNEKAAARPQNVVRAKRGKKELKAGD